MWQPILVIIVSLIIGVCAVLCSIVFSREPDFRYTIQQKHKKALRVRNKALIKITPAAPGNDATVVSQKAEDSGHTVL